LVSRSALLHNLRLLKAHSATEVMAVVKADAYGHGAALVAPLLEKAGLRWFGVATLEEALALRGKGIRSQLMILGAIEESHLAEAARHKVGVTIWSRHFLRAAARHALDVHLKVDTGMNRLGVAPQEVPGLLADFQSGRFGRARLASAYTHLACADEKMDKVSTGQIRTFRSQPWPKSLPLHAANSAAALRYPESRLDRVRSGIFLYGAQERVHPLVRRSRPVLSFRTSVVRVAQISKGQGVSYGHTFVARHPMRVATLCAGYADGLPRLLSNQGSVLIGGKRCQILGRVCMDLCLADVSALKTVHPGDEAVLLGSQAGQDIRASEWAGLCQTNTYEILCGISARVPRELSV
jgi:alanine racemase